MTNTAIRQQLHHFIDIADDDKVAAIYEMFNQADSSVKYSDDDLAEFKRRSDQYKSGQMPSFTMEEAHAYIRQQTSIK